MPFFSSHGCRQGGVFQPSFLPKWATISKPPWSLRNWKINSRTVFFSIETVIEACIKCRFRILRGFGAYLGVTPVVIASRGRCSLESSPWISCMSENRAGNGLELICLYSKTLYSRIYWCILLYDSEFWLFLTDYFHQNVLQRWGCGSVI